VQAQRVDEAQRKAMTTALERIEQAGAAAAAELGVDVRVERDDRGKLPFVGFRLHGYLPVAKQGLAGPGRHV